MRLFLLLLLAGSAGADEITLKERRAWRGTVTVESTARETKDAKGTETQREKAEFVAVTKLPRRKAEGPVVTFETRHAEGEYAIAIDMVEGRGERAVVNKAEGDGRNHVRLYGEANAETGHYRLRVVGARTQFIVRTMLSGKHYGRLATYRVAVMRKSFLRNLELEGTWTGDGRVIEGRKEFVDDTAKYKRDVVVTWRFERVDPVIHGRVRDHLGRPVAGVEIIARTGIGSGRRNFMRKAVTDVGGRFSVDALWGKWWIFVTPLKKDNVVFAPLHVEPADLQFEKVEPLKIEMNAFHFRALRDSHLLDRYYRGDVRAFLDYVLPRMLPEQIEMAKVRKQE